MIVESLAIPDVKLITPRAFGDARGFFMESWNQRAFADAGIDVPFVQDNHSRSSRGVLRGLHYQMHNPQGKLVRVATGAVFDVAVDIRLSSPTYGQWVGAELTDANHQMLFIPPGFAHGFLVLSETADFLYKCTTLWDQPSDRSLIWNDPSVGIAWPLDRIGGEPLLAAKDAAAPDFATAEKFA